MNYFLFKTEPGTYSFDTLAKEKKTNWNHVRNYQARNVLQTCQKGDLALIYHSGDDKAIVGVAQVTKEAYPDFDPEYDEAKHKKSDQKKGFVQIDLKFVMKLARRIPLAEIRVDENLNTLPLVKHTRLSCMPVTKKEFESAMKKGESWAAFQKL